MERNFGNDAPSGLKIVAPVGLEKISPSHIEFEDKYYNQNGQKIIVKSNTPIGTIGQSVKPEHRIWLQTRILDTVDHHNLMSS